MDDFIPRAEVKRAIARIQAEVNEGDVFYGMALMDRAVDRIPSADVVSRAEATLGEPTSVRVKLQKAREQRAEKAEGKDIGLYRCTWKKKSAPDSAPQFFGFVRASDPKDAERIMRENLDDSSSFEVTEVIPARESWITPQSLTVNFRNTAEYRLF